MRNTRMHVSAMILMCIMHARKISCTDDIYGIPQLDGGPAQIWIEDVSQFSDNASFILRFREDNVEKPAECRQDFCPPENITKKATGTFEWPAIPAGYKVVMLCPYAVEEPVYTSRVCHLVDDPDLLNGDLNYTIAEWEDEEDAYCPGPPANEEVKEILADYIPNQREFFARLTELLEKAHRFNNSLLLLNEAVRLLDKIYSDIIHANILQRRKLQKDEIEILLRVLDMITAVDGLSDYDGSILLSIIGLLDSIPILQVEPGKTTKYQSKRANYFLMMEIGRPDQSETTNVTFKSKTGQIESIITIDSPLDVLGDDVEDYLIKAAVVNDMENGYSAPLYQIPDVLPMDDVGLPPVGRLPPVDGLSPVKRKKRQLDNSTPMLCDNPSLSRINSKEPLGGHLEWYDLISGMTYIEITTRPRTSLAPTTSLPPQLFACSLPVEIIYSGLDSGVNDVLCAVVPLTIANTIETVHVFLGGTYLSSPNVPWITTLCMTEVTGYDSVKCLCDTPGYIGVFGFQTAAKLPAVDTDDNSWGRGFSETLGFPFSFELYVTSLVFSSLSVVSLLLTILSYACFRKTRRGTTTRILINLCVALLLMLCFMYTTLGVEMKKPGWRCSLYSSFKYYLILVTLMWNGVEAVHMYIKLVRVFNADIHNFVTKAAVIAYGLPAILLCLIFAIDTNAFRGIYEGCLFRCILSQKEIYFAFLIPVALIMLFNLVVFTKVMIILTRRRPGQSASVTATSTKTYKARLFGAFSMLFLLGIPWIFSVFGSLDGTANIVTSVTEETFQVIFVVLTSLQGVFIFIFNCVRLSEVRNAWITSVSTRRTTRSSESTSSKANQNSVQYSRKCSASNFTAEVSNVNIHVISHAKDTE